MDVPGQFSYSQWGIPLYRTEEILVTPGRHYTYTFYEYHIIHSTPSSNLSSDLSFQCRDYNFCTSILVCIYVFYRSSYRYAILQLTLRLITPVSLRNNKRNKKRHESQWVFLKNLWILCFRNEKSSNDRTTPFCSLFINLLIKVYDYSRPFFYSTN